MGCQEFQLYLICTFDRQQDEQYVLMAVGKNTFTSTQATELRLVTFYSP